MSQNLYEEAIAEARLLRDMAEENAKNKIIDAVTPRIRSLIEQQLLGETDEEEMEELQKIITNITDSLSILLDKKLDLFSSTVNNK